ncbi:hypothetical protein BMF94_1112 [Rhodotorula taiwanensis]|uniref:Uncharacterized protein n=1 Tax=Rhodotorula taiwanensis TaxID=741276 RepID=A0A2S5BGA3_9BASI|nr:hypothetical protein BMF94_1112 [Rhodotorula taiwanensis]
MWLVKLSLIALGGAAVGAQVNPSVAGYGRRSCTNYDGTPNYQYCIGRDDRVALPSDPHTLNYFCGLKGSTCDYPSDPYPPFSQLQAICDGGYCRPGATAGIAYCVLGIELSLRVRYASRFCH